MDGGEYSSLIFLVVLVLLVLVFAFVSVKVPNRLDAYQTAEPVIRAGDALKSSSGNKNIYPHGHGESYPTEASCQTSGNTFSNGNCYCKNGKTGAACDQDLNMPDFQAVSIQLPTNGTVTEITGPNLDFPANANNILQQSRNDPTSIGVVKSGDKYYSITTTSDEIITFNSLIVVDKNPTGWIKITALQDFKLYYGSFFLYNSSAQIKEWWLNGGGSVERFISIANASFHMFNGPWYINDIQPNVSKRIFTINPPATATVISTLKGLTSDELINKFINNEIVGGKENTLEDIATVKAPFTIIILKI